MKKLLDKTAQGWYNIRTAMKGYPSVDLTNNPNTVDENKSAEVDTHIRVIGRAINAVCKENFPGLRPPVIAGGACRDRVFGLEPNDYDIFLDLSAFGEGEREDVPVLFSSRLYEKLDLHQPFEGIGTCCPMSITSEDYAENPEFGVDGFCGYTNKYPATYGWQDPITLVQVIGHNDTRLSAKDPSAFLDAFDYGLVKVLYDPFTEDYVFHKDFLETLETKIIRFKGKTTYHRVNSWLSRWGKPCPFSLEEVGKGKTKHPTFPKKGYLEDRAFSFLPDRNPPGIVLENAQWILRDGQIFEER